MTIGIALVGDDAEKALAKLVANVQYDNLRVEVYAMSKDIDFESRVPKEYEAYEIEKWVYDADGYCMHIDDVCFWRVI